MMGFIFNIFLSMLIDYLGRYFFNWIKQEAQKHDEFKKIDISITKRNKSIKKLLLTSIENAMKNEKIKQLKFKDIKESLIDNKNIIYEWITLKNNIDISFDYYSDKITYYVYKDIFVIFYNSLFNQIKENKCNYPALQDLMIFERLDVIEKIVIADYEINKENNQILRMLRDNIIYTGEFKEIEEMIVLRQFKKAHAKIDTLEHKILSRSEPEETEKFYQLSTDSYFLDIENQQKAIEPLKKLIIHTSDNIKRKKRELLLFLLEKNLTKVQEELDIYFSNTSNTEIDKSFLDIQINVFMNERNYDKAIDFAKKYKEKIDRFPLWICRIYYYQSNIIEAKQTVDENEDFFNKPDFDIQIIKINILAAYYLENATREYSFNNNEKLIAIIPKIFEMINLCEDDLGEKSQLHSILGLIYSVLGDKNNAIKEYEKSLELNHKNMNTLKNYPFILLNSKNKEDKERALEYIKVYLSEYPEEPIIEDLYYNALVFLSPKRAIVELEKYNGKNEDIKPYLIFAYDNIYENSKAEELIKNILSKEKISSSAYFFIGLHHEAIKKYEIALDYYFKAIHNVKTNNELYRTVDKILQISILLKDKGLMKKGLEIIENKVSFDEIIMQFIDQFVSVLILLGDYEKCFFYCDTAVKYGIKTKNIYETLFCSYYNTGNFILALEILDIYIKEFGQPPQQYLQAIALCYKKSNNIEKVSNIIKYLPSPKSVNDFLYQINFLKDINKKDEAIKMAHEAYISFPKNQYVMEHFIQLALINRGNCILSNEIASNLQKCINEYLTSDFQNKMLQEFKIDTNAKPEEIRKQIASFLPESIDFTSKFNIINKNRLPISFYQNVISKNMLIIYDYITKQREYKIWCFDGNVNKIILSTNIYIDMGSLLLLNKLELLETLPEIFSEIYIVQSIFDEIIKFKSEIPETDGKIINKDKNGNIYFTEDNIPYNEILNNSEKIISFINSNSNVKVVGKPLMIINELTQDEIGLLNTLKNNPDFIVIEYGYLSNNAIMLENITLRHLYNSFNIASKSFGIIEYLLALVYMKKITVSRYCQILKLMSKQNYTSLPFDYNVLYTLIKQNEYIINDSITHIFDALCSEYYNKGYSCINITATLFMLWNDDIDNNIKHKWTDYLMDKIFTYFNAQKIYIQTIYDCIPRFVYKRKYQKDFKKYFKKYIKDNKSKNNEDTGEYK